MSEDKKIIDIEEIMEVIPHRPPFLLIDKILEVESGKRVKALKNVSMNEGFFAGHFPQKPVMPGVLIVEAMAQAGAYAILSMPENKGRLAFFGALDNVKFRRMVVPGDQIIFDVEIVKMKKAAGVGRGVATVNGEKVCEGEFTFMLG